MCFRVCAVDAAAAGEEETVVELKQAVADAAGQSVDGDDARFARVE